MAEKVLGAFVFPTRKAAEAEIRRILHEAPLRQPLVGDEDLLIRALVACHPTAQEKTGCGIASIDVRVIDHGSRGFWITRSDGSAVDFSYRKALDGAPTHRQVVVASLRHEIREQIDDFRRHFFSENQWPTCPLTNQPLFMGPEAHVDHIAPTFAELAEVFVAVVGGWQAIRCEPATDGVGSRLSDRSLAIVWQQYHRQHAVLRVIHKSANLRRYRAGAA